LASFILRPADFRRLSLISKRFSAWHLKTMQENLLKDIYVNAGINH